MSQFIRVFMLGLVIIGFVACSKSSNQKAFVGATDLVHERTVLSTELNEMGPPNSNWSAEKLEIYEARVNRLETVEKLMRAADGAHGVIVKADYNDDFIEEAHHNISRIRGRKNHPGDTPEYDHVHGQRLSHN